MSHFRVLHWQQWQPPASAPDPFNINFAFFIGKKTELMAYSCFLFFFFYFFYFFIFYFLFLFIFFFATLVTKQLCHATYDIYLFIYLFICKTGHNLALPLPAYAPNDKYLINV